MFSLFICTVIQISLQEAIVVNLYWPYLEMNPKFVYYFLMNDSATSMVGSKIFSILFICVKFCYSILETSVAVVILNGNLPQHDEVKVI